MKILKWIVWLALAILCASAIAGRVEGAWAWVWVPAAFYAPWGLRAAIRGDQHEAGNERFWSLIIALCLLALLASGCAGIDAETRAAQRKAAFDAEWAKNFTPATISFHSAPSGAVVDWNGDVIGTTPFEYHIPDGWRGGWPANGHTTQILRARWLDGMMQHEFYPINGRIPKKVLFMHPRATDYLVHPAPRLSQN
jgi:hypothetical protein